MTIIIDSGYRPPPAEVEFFPKHPDVYSTAVAANLVQRFAEIAERRDQLQGFRADLNVQSAVRPPSKQSLEGRSSRPFMIHVGIAGQLMIQDHTPLEEIARDVVTTTLQQAGYFRDGDFHPNYVLVDIRDITPQGLALNGTTKQNRFADSCTVHGHYIASPYGIDGTFPSLGIASVIDRLLSSYFQESPEARPDGKVHVTVRYTPQGFVCDDPNGVYISLAHKKGATPEFFHAVRAYLAENLSRYHVSRDAIAVNAGGEFAEYFLPVDAGVSKVKDSVIATGGVHQHGTDAIWGKCLWKASSTLYPYAYALARAVCEVTHAQYASICLHARHNQELAAVQIEDLDPALANYDTRELGRLRERMTHALSRERSAFEATPIPLDRDGIRDILGMPVTLETYRLFNDPQGFHDPEKPWKLRNEELNDRVSTAFLRSGISV